MRSALVVHGGQGVGKNLFFEAVMRIYGEYGSVIDQAAVEDKFNDWASRKLFMVADEVVARAELWHLKNKLKGIVTGTLIRINSKNVTAWEESNHVNLVFLSNERQPVAVESDDRRYRMNGSRSRSSPTIGGMPSYGSRTNYPPGFTTPSARKSKTAALRHYTISCCSATWATFAPGRRRRRPGRAAS
jgi:hypothetical protein